MDTLRAARAAVYLKGRITIREFDLPELTVIEMARVQAAKDFAVEVVAPRGTIANCRVCTPQRLLIDFMTLLLKDV
jgi:hypothetical protein